jgi:ribosomal protein S18 acetylase RimI-like enzyme
MPRSGHAGSAGACSRFLIARARARALGWPRLVVSGISTDNVRARRLYEGAGFQITGTTGDPERPMWTMELPFS